VRNRRRHQSAQHRLAPKARTRVDQRSGDLIPPPVKEVPDGNNDSRHTRASVRSLLRRLQTPIGDGGTDPSVSADASWHVQSCDVKKGRGVEFPYDLRRLAASRSSPSAGRLRDRRARLRPPHRRALGFDRVGCCIRQYYTTNRSIAGVNREASWGTDPSRPAPPGGPQRVELRGASAAAAIAAVSRSGQALLLGVQSQCQLATAASPAATPLRSPALTCVRWKRGAFTCGLATTDGWSGLGGYGH